MRYQTCRLHLHYTSFKAMMSPHLPRNLVLTLLNITIKLSLIEIMSVPKDSVLIVPQSFTLHVELRSVQLFFLFLFRQCQTNQHKAAEEHWETADHTAGGFRNACSQLTQILLQLPFPFQ